MRIISGTSKGRKLVTPKGSSVRPTSDRVKESIFNILGGEVEGKAVLDLFAGTGNLGIEALSRGAKKAIFVEKGWQGLRLIRQNLLQCGMVERAEIISKDAIRSIGFLNQRGESFDLILMDPPYEKGLIQRILNKLHAHPIYRDDAILVIEHGRREPLPKHLWGWELIRQRQIGDTIISFLIPQKDRNITDNDKQDKNVLPIE